MSNFMLMSLGLPLPVAALFWRLPTLFGPGWLDVVSGRTAASLVTAGFRGQHVSRGHAFAEGGSPVCFAEMPFRQSHGRSAPAVAACPAYPGRSLEMPPKAKRSKVSFGLIVL
jgi:hypothetical protein